MTIIRTIKISTLLLLILSFFLTSSTDAIEKERLQAFFIEYDASKERKENKWDRLPYAIEKGYPDIAEFLILKGDIVSIYTEPYTNLQSKIELYVKHPLITAIKNGYVDLAIFMIQSSKNNHEVNEYKRVYLNNSRTPDRIIEYKHVLFVAMTTNSRSYDIMHALLTAGVDANLPCIYRDLIQNKDKNHTLSFSTPLIVAIDLKKLDIAQLVLDNNANVNFGFNDITPLHVAINNNFYDGVRLLLSYGANPLMKEGHKFSPLELAMQKGYWDIIDLLLDAAVKDDQPRES